MNRLRDPLLWLALLFVALLLAMPHSEGLFHWLFPGLARPVYLQESFVALTLSHLGLVAAAGAVSVACGVAVGIAVTRPWGREFRA
ncbi:ABC transporter permease, partial [Cronobacter sakazakii]